ncbi:MAG: MoxR family ATPase [Candidatus Celaenobacter antarcticus]|nr:MoxR family ATPase [Candidatus Celaenobacter antarcticus]MDP8314110.1 MoxR family ATPase [Candidatus Celaenobacter antarcticus]
MNIQEINQRVIEKTEFVQSIFTEIGKVIVGQEYMIRRLLIGLFADGHVLLEGVPGLAKTLSVSTLADVISVAFNRIQFTPDLLPADLIGTLIFNQKEGTFTPKKGPIFSNIILADEINRAPSKVQSALLEAMQERQVTIGEKSYKLDEPFLVLATQNPIEQEGTYPLPEAQVDRFMLKLKVTYPKKDEEREIINRMCDNKPIKVNKVIKPKDVLDTRALVNDIYVDEKIKEYVLNIVFSTRTPEEYGLKDISEFIEFGASPRASIYLVRAAKANALLDQRGYVSPEDIKEIGKDVLRHRIIMTYEAEAENVNPEDIVDRIFDEIEIP